MLHKIVVKNPKGEALEMELPYPDKCGFTVAKVEGLGPPQATINGQEMASTDGMFYSSARASARQIIFTLEFHARDRNSIYGELSIEECRHLCYRYFPLKKQITIIVYTDSQTLYTTGYVESNEPEIFSQQEYATISIICPDPYMYEYDSDSTTITKIVPIFEFPFSNESLIEPLLEMSEFLVEPRATLDYKGTVDTGVIIDIFAKGPCGNITLYNVDTLEQISIDTDMIASITGKAFGNGDSIIISTIREKRYCRLLRDGFYINIIGAIGRDSDWFQISNGANVFTFSAQTGETKISVTFSYQNAYMGV